MNQYKHAWSVDDILFDFDDEGFGDLVASAVAFTPARRLEFMADVEVRGSTLVLRGLHVQGASSNAVGTRNMMVLAQALMERIGFDGLIVEGAVRTSGANPGHRPRVLRFTRRLRAAPAAESRGD